MRFISQSSTVLFAALIVGALAVPNAWAAEQKAGPAKTQPPAAAQPAPAATKAPPAAAHAPAPPAPAATATKAPTAPPAAAPAAPVPAAAATKPSRFNGKVKVFNWSGYELGNLRTAWTTEPNNEKKKVNYLPTSSYMAAGEARTFDMKAGATGTGSCKRNIHGELRNYTGGIVSVDDVNICDVDVVAFAPCEANTKKICAYPFTLPE